MIANAFFNKKLLVKLNKLWALRNYKAKKRIEGMENYIRHESLRKRRRKFGVRLEQLAERCKVEQERVSKYERGLIKLGRRTIWKLDQAVWDLAFPEK